MSNQKKFYEAVALMVGIIIGAGILGIPYVMWKAGFLTGLLDIVGIGLAILFVNLALGEVVLRTEGRHQLTGYAEKYLGKWGKWLMSFSFVFGIYTALIAYIIGEGISINALFGFDPFYSSLIFFLVFSAVVFFGLKLVGESELYMTSVKIIIFLIMISAIFLSGKFSLTHLANFNPALIFIPYGVILFAFIGTAAIPEVKEIIAENKNAMKKAIVLGTLIPFAVYLVFAIAVVGVSAEKTTEVATVGLGLTVGYSMIIMGNLFAIIAMATSFLGLALALKDVFIYDFKIDKYTSWVITCAVPLVVFLAGASSFIGLLGISGAVAGGIDGILIMLMHHKAKKIGKRKPEYSVIDNQVLRWLIIALFAGGMIYAVLVR